MAQTPRKGPPGRQAATVTKKSTSTSVTVSQRIGNQPLGGAGAGAGTGGKGKGKGRASVGGKSRARRELG